MKVWKDKLHDVYSSLDEFIGYCDIYDCHTRLGYKTPEDAWAENPLIQGSTDPKDYKKVNELKKEDFTYNVNAEGYMIYYKGIGIGGAGIKGKFSGRGRAKQIKDNAEGAKREIDSYLRGYMPPYVRETIKNINISKEQNKTV